MNAEELKLLVEKQKLLEQKVQMQEGLPFLHGWPWYKWAYEFFNSTAKMNFLVAANQVSKALDDDTEIPTTRGFKRMGDLVVGDFVYGRDGKPTQIVDIPFKGEDQCYLVKFDDGSSVIASKDHRWICKTSRERFRKSYKSKGTGRVFENPTFDKWVEKSTKEIIESGQYAPDAPRPWFRVSIPNSEPVKLSRYKLFDPYMIGLLLGDGGYTSRSVTITTADQEIAEYITTKHGAKKNGKSKYTYRLNGFQVLLRYLEMMGKHSRDKEIPKQYLNGSIEDRLALLRGLMDTDGTISSRNHVTSFTTTSPKLRDGFEYLVASLGGTTETRTRKTFYTKNGIRIHCRDAYHITVKIGLCPFLLTRKSIHFRPIRYRRERIIYSIVPVGIKKCTCITVDNSDGSFLCTNKFIVTHNSSTQIRKCIDWATDQKKWPLLWRRRPVQFWYMYPSQKVANTEWITKWSLFMPKGKFKEDPIYGWKEEKNHGDIVAIHFFSGVHVYFKTYSQSAEDLQTATVDALFLDEELPEELWDELAMRVNATNGYIHMVFTATLGQEFWRKVMEPRDDENELLPEASKWNVSLYDSQKYIDGTQSQWTDEKIAEVKARCKNHAEFLKRVMGRFVVSGGRKYEQFDPTKHMVKRFEIPNDWYIYEGVDVGSGGEDGHPSAICFVAVRPDYRFGAVFSGWRGDGIETTAGDVYQKHLELKKEINRPISAQYYDWGAKDFFTIASRAGDGFIPAEKSHEIGENIINTLFKNDMLVIFEDGELNKLGTELSTLMVRTPKRKAKDDFSDGFRYSVTKVPWDFSALTGADPEWKKVEIVTLTPAQQQIKDRRDFVSQEQEEDEHGDVESELKYWNDLY